MAIKKPTIWMLDVRKIARKLRGFELSFPGIYDYVKYRYEFSKKNHLLRKRKVDFIGLMKLILIELLIHIQ